jgi:hypothetical protein
VDIALASGVHGGGDAALQRQIFDPQAAPDEWRRSAGHEQGAASMLIGAAVNQSLGTGRAVSLGDLCSLNPQAAQLHELI